MSFSKNNYEGIRSVAVIGNYLPRVCGIATFTTDIVEALTAQSPEINCWAIAMNDKVEGYDYPDRVRFEINQKKLIDYNVAAEFLNINEVDIVSVQHEYGIFGGPAGSHILQLLANLRMPVVTTLHTVLKDPAPEYREVMNKLSNLSDKLVVMSHKAAELLMEVYHVPEDKIAFIHHGIPDTPFIDPNYYKDQFGVEGRKVILTFGLLSPNKGIETVLRALPAVIKKHPDLTYIILGATHPHVLLAHGEEYRISLQRLVHSMGLDDHVIFKNRFVDLKKICEYLGMADIYATPYLEEAQITSGTLAYAMGMGKAIISTPYWYATEMLAEGRGLIVPFKDCEAMGAGIIELLDNDILRNTMRKKAYSHTREAVWKEVSQKYLDVFEEVQIRRSEHPRARYTYIENIKLITEFELPEPNFYHLKILTDDTGIMQHATFNIPNRLHGYCTDDNARALLAVAMGQKVLTDVMDFNAMSGQYLSFLLHAYNRENGRFRNFMTYQRNWTEDYGSEDSHGRAVWSLGRAVQLLNNSGHVACSSMLFKSAITAVEDFNSPRAIAFSLVGIDSYLSRFSGDSQVRNIRDVLANRLFHGFIDYASPQWPWPESSLNYANGKLPHALILSGVKLNRQDMTDMGLKALRWLLTIQTEDGHFVPIGNQGWYKKGERRARFDQQPIEAHALIEACVEAYNITCDKFWFDCAVQCFNWFLGDNDLNMSIYVPKSGGCRDGLMADGINQNQGAESTLAWLISLMTMQKLYADEVLKPHALRLPAAPFSHARTSFPGSTALSLSPAV